MKSKKYLLLKAVKAFALAAAVCVFTSSCGTAAQETEIISEQISETTAAATAAAESITINDIPEQMAAGTEAEVKCSVLPEGATDEIVLDSSDESVVKVNGDRITAVKEGKAVITARAGDVSAQAEVTVFVKADEIKLSSDEMKLTIGESKSLNYTVLPKEARKTAVTFSSDNNRVASVGKKGTVKAVGVGTAKITAVTENGDVKAECTVTVEPIHVKKIRLDETDVTLGKGQNYKLLVDVSPSNATFKDVEWKTSNASVATVNNGAVKAVGIGEATISAVTDRGEKKAECKIKVLKEAPKNKTYYMRSTYNVRELPTQNSPVLTKVKQNSAVELLVDYGDSLKVRTNDGTVGFILAGKEVLSSVKPVLISGVPYINQLNIGLPTGCEAVSATMVMQYYGYKVNPEQMVAATPTGKGKYQKDGVWYAANPFEEFVGDPHKKLKDGSYGCFAKPITTAMNTFAGGRAKNISGCKESDLYRYVAAGKPVVVWGVARGNPVTNGVTWNYVDKNGVPIGGSYKELVHEHCFVLIGYDDTYVYLNDPVAGKCVTQKKSAFSQNWNKLFKQAIIIE